MDDFALRALAAGCGVALVSGPLGCFVVWRRMAFFGGALSHSALLGVALGFLLGIDLTIGTVAVCVAVALLLILLERSPTLSGDTLLGILAHGALALGLVVLSFLDAVRIDLMGYLFGDILAVTAADIAWIYGAGAVVMAMLALLWKPLLAITVHADLAVVEGVPVTRVRIAFVLLLAVVVALAMKVVGILLVTSLIIIPAAAARRFARTPEQMAGFAAALGCAAVAAGIWGSFAADVPTGPAIVVAACVVFAGCGAVSALNGRR
ncbi:MAG: metal ABC transporter permease [Rhodospirillales bacterium]|jgi:zinc transport system permease protein|nr:metal ABC transporter permease [Rhodospirillales bacterium]